MDFITQLFSENTLHALGWTVLHSFWQAFMVALIFAAYLLAWKKQGAQKRYLASYLALGTTLLMAILTFLWLLSEAEATAAMVSEVTAVDGEELGRIFMDVAPSAMAVYFNEHLPLIVTAWLLGMGVFILKMLGGLLYIQRLKHRRNRPLTGNWQRQLQALGSRLGMQKAVRLAESALVHTPMVAGWLKPVILIPIGAVNNLTAEQVEAILAHELAHIYRHDYLLNLLQSVIEFLFYFNPAVWWISANIRTERENCCDDLAIGLCGNPLTYARALVSLQEMRQVAPAFAMPFSQNKNQLLNRINRILQPSPSKSNAMEKLSATLLLLAAVLMLSVQANTTSGHFKDHFASGEITEAAPAGQTAFAKFASLPQVAADTVPKAKNKTWFHRQNDDGDVEIVLEDNKIVSLKIDGEEIPKERYGEYGQLAEELLQEVESMPEAPQPPEAPLPPAPPRFAEPLAAPRPPAPPAAPAAPRIYKEKRSRKIISRQDGKNTTLIIETERGGEPVEIKIKDGKKSKIIINGKKLKKGKKGKNKKIIIEEEVEENSPGYIFLGDEGVYRFDGIIVTPEANSDARIHVFPRDYVVTVPKLAEVFPGADGLRMLEWREEHLQNLEELKQQLEEGLLDKENLERFTEEIARQFAEPKVIELEELRSKMEEERAIIREHNNQLRDTNRDQLREFREQQRELRGQQREMIRQRSEEQRNAIEEYQRALENLKKKKTTRRLISNTAQ
jgi:bla regulator protein blaR1